MSQSEVNITENINVLYMALPTSLELHNRITILVITHIHLCTNTSTNTDTCACGRARAHTHTHTVHTHKCTYSNILRESVPARYDLLYPTLSAGIHWVKLLGELHFVCFKQSLKLNPANEMLTAKLFIPSTLHHQSHEQIT